jgi:hypothetical protein
VPEPSFFAEDPGVAAMAEPNAIGNPTEPPLQLSMVECDEFKVGDRVRALAWNGKWRKATISSVQGVDGLAGPSAKMFATYVLEWDRDDTGEFGSEQTAQKKYAELKRILEDIELKEDEMSAYDLKGCWAGCVLGGIISVLSYTSVENAHAYRDNGCCLLCCVLPCPVCDMNGDTNLYERMRYTSMSGPGIHSPPKPEGNRFYHHHEETDKKGKVTHREFKPMYVNSRCMEPPLPRNYCMWGFRFC